MRPTYADTSALVALAFDEPGSGKVAGVLEECEAVFASNLLEAELRATLVREDVATLPSFVDAVTWVLPPRPLTDEISRVLSAGYVRGADAWHLATALYLVEAPGDLDFLTLDARQREVAEALGFGIPI